MTYLFVIVMEAPNCLLKRAKYGGFLSSCRVRGRGNAKVKVSHLLIVVDTLIFYDASQKK